jgi:ABC-type phosphate transport system permease subunit
LVTGTLVLLIVLFLLLESLPALRDVGITRFVSDPSWHPAAGSAEGQFNLLPMIVATTLATAGAILLATPLGIGSAVFAHYYAPRALGRAYGKIIELLAGIPSVVYGLWGLVVLVPIVARWQPPGTSLLSAIILLTIMIVPTIVIGCLGTLAMANREWNCVACCALRVVYGRPAGNRPRDRRDDGGVNGRRQRRAISAQHLPTRSHADREHRVGNGLRHGRPPRCVVR